MCLPDPRAPGRRPGMNNIMKLTHRFQYLALLSALGLPACTDPKSDDTDASSTMTPLTTTDNGTTAALPTTGGDPTDGGTSGTTGPEPTTGEDIDPALYDQCKDSDVDAAKLAETQCMCLVAADIFPDQDSCLAELGTSPEEADCSCMVYAKHPETKAVLDCVGPAQKTYADCIAQAGCDDAATQACNSAYFDVVIECPEPAEGLNNQISVECLGETPFMCGSGEQVPESYKCDFESDCMDGSDEVGCDNAFMCMNGSVIMLDYKCDGFLDCCEGDPECRDMSDEDGCPVFMCTNGEVVPEQFKCNGDQDCEDGSDEENCPVFMCMDGQEIPLDWECDGEPDCEDGSDEVSCN